MNPNDLIQQWLIPIMNSVGYGPLVNSWGLPGGPYTMIVRPVNFSQRVNFNTTFTVRQLYDGVMGPVAGAIPVDEVAPIFIGTTSVSSGLGNTSANDATAVFNVNIPIIAMPAPDPALPAKTWDSTRLNIPGNSHAAAIYCTQQLVTGMWSAISITPSQPGNTNEVSLIGAVVSFKKNF